LLTHRLAHRARRLAARRTDQGGYILITTLTVFIVCLILITVLLNLALSTANVEGRGLSRERQARSAEGGLNVAINQIRNNPSLPVVNPNTDTGFDCNAVSPDMVVDGVRVRVGCIGDLPNGEPRIPENNNQVAVRLVGEAYKGGTGGYQNLGMGVESGDPDLTAWRSNATWTNAVSGRGLTGLSDNDAQLLHLGAVPLRIVGGLEVRREVAAVRTNPQSTPAVEVYGPATQGGDAFYVGSSSRTVQSDPPSDPRCGITETTDQWSIKSTDVFSFTDFSISTDAFECGSDRMAGMSEGGAISPAGDWTNQDVQGRKSVATGPGTGVQDASVNPSANPNCDGWRPPGKPAIFYFEGAYDAVDTAILNKWFDDSSPDACNEATFWFGGDVWFDVNNTEFPAGDPRRHALVINNRTSNFVFGAPSGPQGEGSWETRTGIPPAPQSWFPQHACDNEFNPVTPNGSGNGSSITLSSRTGLVHKQGRVVVCGYRLAGQKWHNTAIWQRPASGLGAQLKPTAISGDANWFDVPGGVGKVEALRGTGENSRRIIRTEVPMPDVFDIPWVAPRFCWPWESDCDFFGRIWEWIRDNALALWGSLCWVDGTCSYDRSFTAGNFQPDGPNAPDLSSQATNNAWLDIAVDSDYANHTARAKTVIKVDFAAVPEVPAVAGTAAIPAVPARSCTITYGPGNEPKRMGDNYSMLNIDLVSACPAGTITNRAQLKGASVTVTFTVNPPPLLTEQLAALCLINIFGWRPFNCDYPDVATVSVDYIGLRTAWSPQMVNNPGAGAPATPSRSPASVPCLVDAVGQCTYFGGLAPTAAPGTYVDAAARNDGTYARLNMNQSKTLYEGTMDWTLNDDSLRDGFLPVNTLSLDTRMRHSGPVQFGGASPTRVDFIVTLPRRADNGTPVTCTASFSGTTALQSKVPAETNPDTTPVSNFTLVGAGAPSGSDCGTKIKEVGDLVTYERGGVRNEAKVTMRVFVSTSSLSAATWDVDFLKLNVSTNNVSYPRPLAPFRVTWNPMPLNNDGTAKPGDAVFAVYGTTSVPNNAVQVAFDDRGRATGRGMFNGAAIGNGTDPVPECTAPLVTTLCRPGLIAGALATWTRGSDWYRDPDTNEVTTDGTVPYKRLPDPVATSGKTRPPDRNVRLTACVVTNDKGDSDPTNDELRPRFLADVRISDVDGNVLRPGAVVTIRRWAEMESGDLTSPLQIGTCSRLGVQQ
jgi:hypothetical protein